MLTAGCGRLGVDGIPVPNLQHPKNESQRISVHCSVYTLRLQGWQALWVVSEQDSSLTESGIASRCDYRAHRSLDAL